MTSPLASSLTAAAAVAVDNHRSDTGAVSPTDAEQGVNVSRDHDERHWPMTDKVSAAAAALWHFYKDMNMASGEPSWPAETALAARPDDAAVLEDVLCGLRQQQLFQLHLLRQLQRQIDQLAVAGALLGPHRQPWTTHSGSTVAVSTPPPTVASTSADHVGVRPLPTVTAAPRPLSPQYVMPSSPSPSVMTSDLSPMSAMIDMSRKRLSQLPVCTTTAPSVDLSAPASCHASNDARRHGNGYYRHRCRYCRKEFHGESALQIHIRSHTGERPFKCSICRSCFSTKGNLKVHMTGHSGAEFGPPTKAPLLGSHTKSPLPRHGDLRRDDCQERSVEDAATASTVRSSSQRRCPSTNTTPESSAPPVGENGSQETQPDSDDNITSNSTSDVSPDTVVTGCSSSATASLSDGLVESSNQNDTFSVPLQSTSVCTASTWMSPGVPLPSTNNFRLRCCPASTVPLQSTSSVAAMNRLSTPAPYFDPLEQFMEVDSSRSGENSYAEKLAGRQKCGELDANQCAVCLRTLSCRSALLMHYRTHTGERPFRCRLCGRAFTTKGNLKTHMGVHRAKPAVRSVHACPVCHKLFSNTAVLQQHVRLHSAVGDIGQLPSVPVPRPPPFNPLAAHSGLVAPTPVLMTSSLPAYFPFGTRYAPFFPLSAATSHPLPTAAVLCVQNRSRDSTNNSDVDTSQSSSEHCDSTSPTGRQQSDEEAGDEDDEEMLDVGTIDDRWTTTVSASPSTPTQDDDIRQPDHVEEEHDDDDDVEPVTVESPLKYMERIVHRANRSRSATPHDTRDAEQHSSSHSGLASGRGTVVTRTRDASDRLTAGKQLSKKATEVDLESKRNPAENGDMYKANGDNLSFRAYEKGTSMYSPETHHAAESPDSSEVVERRFNDDRDHHLDASRNNLEVSEKEETSLETIRARMTSTMLQTTTTSTMKSAAPRHTCSVCRKPFSSASALQIHMRTHTGDRPFSCDVCGKAFTTKGNLKVHVGTHSWPSGRLSSRRGRRLSVAVSPVPRPSLPTAPIVPSTHCHLYPMLPAYIYRHGLMTASFASAAANPTYRQNRAVPPAVMSAGAMTSPLLPVGVTSRLSDRYAALQPTRGDDELDLSTRRKSTSSDADGNFPTQLQSPLVGWPLMTQRKDRSPLCSKVSSTNEVRDRKMTSQLDVTTGSPGSNVIAS